MENRFDNRDFEQFVKRNADQYRMFPSEKVWNNIHFNIHTRRRWYGIGIGLLLLTMGTVTWVMLNNSTKNNLVSSYTPSSEKKSPVLKNNYSVPSIFVAAEKKNRNGSHFTSTAENLQEKVFLTSIANENIADNNLTEPVSDFNTGTDANNSVIAFAPVKNSVETSLPDVKPEITAKPVLIYHKPLVSIKQVIAKTSNQEKNNIPSITESNNQLKPSAENTIATADKKDIYPMTIESVINSYQFHKTRKKLSWEIFFTPTVGYRRLSENKDFIATAQARNNTLNYTAFSDINTLVTHKPDMGLQVGFSAGYPLFKNVKIIGGLQFNVSKYDIRAFYSSSEVATIALDAGAGANSVSTTTNYRNISGSNSDWLRNLYFSASAPVGLELKIAGKSKTQFGIRGTVQPTYILGDQAYLISTDYKNYAEVPSLIRKWNINTGLEAFVTYSTGKIKWKIGPQARYQAKSSFKASYPIKERLFDFGLKIGIMLR